MKRLGTVETKGQVGSTDVKMVWNHMEVNCPMLSMVRLCENGNGLWIDQDGGEIVNLESGRRMQFHKLNGVYYVKIKIHDPNGSSEGSAPVFSRPGA